MGNGRAGKACTDDHNIGGGWEMVSAPVAVKFVRRNAPERGERGWCGRWFGRRHCCSCCRLNHNVSSLLSSIRILSWPARYRVLASMEPGGHYPNNVRKCCTGPVYGQGACGEETDNASTYLDHRES